MIPIVLLGTTLADSLRAEPLEYQEALTIQSQEAPEIALLAALLAAP
jgi:hypothetical protein